MDLFSPLRFGARVAVGAVKVATAVPRALIETVTERGRPSPRIRPSVGRPDASGAPTAAPQPSGPARGGTGRRAPGPRATPGRASSPDESVEVTAAPPEPTSAAGASGGIAGTADAPGDAGAAGAPDPTAASAAEAAPQAPRRERARRDTAPSPSRRRARTPDPRRSEIDSRRERGRRVPDADPVVETEGAAAPGAEIRVEAPWKGYDAMKAGDIVARVRDADDAQKAVVRLYEQTHKKRKSILEATQ